MSAHDFSKLYANVPLPGSPPEAPVRFSTSHEATGQTKRSQNEVIKKAFTFYKKSSTRANFPYGISGDAFGERTERS
ncbi:MAG: hypothetical protein CFE23_14440 [Flavobacterium sp. BFFFF1]|nr:MAG: hypothetical protein CFE23_14440 [Flavobacterium sp. BFFFF1]